MLVMILLIFAIVCFTLNAIPKSVGDLNLDAAGKAFTAGALMAYLF